MRNYMMIFSVNADNILYRLDIKINGKSKKIHAKLAKHQLFVTNNDIYT